MRILIVHQFLWAHYKAAIFSEFQQLINKRTSVHVKVLQTALYEKARIGFGAVDRSIHKYNYELLFEEVYEHVPLLNRFYTTLKRVVAFKPDVINLPGYYEPAMVLVQLCCRLMGIKVVLSIDSTESDNANVWYREAIKRFIIGQANGFFCYGTLAADYMKKLGANESQILMRNNAVDNDAVATIYNQTDKEALRKQHNVKTKRNFIYIGRLMKIKNIICLLDAFESLNTDDWGLLLVGNGGDKEEILDHIEKNGLKNITFVSAQPWQKVPEYLALADVLVLPSYSEPWGLVVNEAMACGVPVIVSDKCGCSIDLVQNNINGFTFDPTNINELASRMSYFVENPEKIDDFGRKGKDIIIQYSPRQVAEDMLAGFEKII